MTIDEFLGKIDHKSPPAPLAELAAFEQVIGHPLPDDYRRFLVDCNGGHLGGSFWFQGPTPGGETAATGVSHIYGFRQEWHFSLAEHRQCYEEIIPEPLIWVMDDGFGDALCIGISGPHLGRMFFCHREYELVETWEQSIDSVSSGLFVLADSFTDFIAQLRPLEPAA